MFPARPDAAPSFAPRTDAAPFFAPHQQPAGNGTPAPQVPDLLPAGPPINALESQDGPVTDQGGLGGTPIFEEVTSGWFRSYRHVPITWQDGAAPDGEPVGPAVTNVPEPRHEIGRDAFASPADDAAPVPRTPGRLDANGLPHRTPGAQLVAGSVPAPGPLRQRDPEAIRDRLTGYHRGVRDGRAADDGAED